MRYLRDEDRTVMKRSDKMGKVRHGEIDTAWDGDLYGSVKHKEGVVEIMREWEMIRDSGRKWGYPVIGS
jgi:hypothetical protein